jgi:O-succinylbenzoate synthase
LCEAIDNGCLIAEDFCAPVSWALSSSQWDFPTPAGSVLLNALLDASDSSVVDQALSRHTEGYRCFKIKIGDGNLSEEITRIAELSKVLGKGITLRLDANRKLRLETAVEFARALKKTSIEYFEEPFADLGLIDEFHRLTGMKVALDETVLTPDFERYQRHEAVSTYVLKASRIGTLAEVMRLINVAKSHDRNFVVSSTFESGIGLSVLAKLAVIGQARPVAMGLGTGSYFAADLVAPPLRPFRGHLVFGAPHRVSEQVYLEESRYCELVFERRFP